MGLPGSSRYPVITALVDIEIVRKSPTLVPMMKSQRLGPRIRTSQGFQVSCARAGTGNPRSRLECTLEHADTTRMAKRLPA